MAFVSNALRPKTDWPRVSVLRLTVWYGSHFLHLGIGGRLPVVREASAKPLMEKALLSAVMANSRTLRHRKRHAVGSGSLPDTERAEDRAEQVVAGEFAGDLAERVLDLA